MVSEYGGDHGGLSPNLVMVRGKTVAESSAAEGARKPGGTAKDERVEGGWRKLTEPDAQVRT